MFTTRPCGCKGQRSCLVCETEYGAYRLPSSNFTDDHKVKKFGIEILNYATLNNNY